MKLHKIKSNEIEYKFLKKVPGQVSDTKHKMKPQQQENKYSNKLMDEERCRASSPLGSVKDRLRIG